MSLCLVGRPMPELPEVETVRRQLAPRLVGRTILEAGSHVSAKFTPARETTGATFGLAGRRGKYLLLPLTSPTGSDIAETGDQELIVHLGMTGKLQFRSGEPDDSSPYLRAWWYLDTVEGAGHETLEFVDVRRFGRLRVVPAGDYSTIPTLHKAGPEPWDPALTDKRFWELLNQSRRVVKTKLLSQRPIAGVGNIYADEALWIAKINPKNTRLGQERAGDLLTALRQVLQAGIDNGGTTLRDYRNVDGDEGMNQHELVAYGRAGQPCLRCETKLVSEQLDARTTTWCPRCQHR